MASLRDGYSAVVLGSTGGIATALTGAVRDDARCGNLLGFGRRDGFDLRSEASVRACAEQAREACGEIDLLVVATGVLQAGSREPERSLRDWSADAFAELLQINAIGPALALKHFTPLLQPGRRHCVAVLSARLGSIGDNDLGGWASFRSSKAALNQIVRTAALELRRTHPLGVVVSYHPGTVATRFSEGRGRQLARLSAAEAASRCLRVLDGLDASQTGSFLDHRGATVPW